MRNLSTNAIVFCIAAVSANAACYQLTQQKIDSAVAHVRAGLAKATSDADANGTTGANRVAAVYNRDYLKAALDSLLDLRIWLVTNGSFESGYVTNQSAAYNIHQTTRDTTYQLLHARHWATISAVYHRSTPARDSVADTTRAIQAVELLGSDAAVCYMSGYFTD